MLLVFVSFCFGEPYYVAKLAWSSTTLLLCFIKTATTDIVKCVFVGIGAAVHGGCYMCACTHACVETRGQCQMSSSRTLSTFFETEALTGLEMTNQTGLAAQGAPREPPREPSVSASQNCWRSNEGPRACKASTKMAESSPWSLPTSIFKCWGSRCSPLHRAKPGSILNQGARGKLIHPASLYRSEGEEVY